MVDLPWPALRSLCALVERGTMTAAAEKLGYSTGAVSQHLATLESAVGAALLTRRGRNVVPTDAGLLLATRAARLLEDQRVALQQVNDTSGKVAGTVRLGMFATVAASLLPAIVEQLASRLPDVALESYEIAVDDITSTVARGDVDLGLGLDYPSALIPRERGTALELVQRETFSLVTARPATLPKRVALSDAADLDWILPPAHTHFGLAVRSACRQAGFEPRAVHEVNDTATSLALVAQGLGVALATPLMLRLTRADALCLSELEARVERHLVLVQPEGGSARRSVAAVTEVIRKVAAQAVPVIGHRS
ncbi:LysR family transcriptional regulator [Georgenia ruanii]|nr:LysR family transcriptional regulator [Georgenia ruanii]